MTSRPRVSVVCAPDSDRNPGMAAANLAATTLLARLVPAVETKVFVPYGPIADDISLERAVLGTGNVEQVLDADAIVFWGDFLHAAFYQRSIAQGVGGRAPLVDIDAVRRFLLLEGVPDDVLARTLLFGGSLILNTAADNMVGEYVEPLTRLVRGSAGVWMRDTYSAMFAAELRGTLPAVRLGIDACSVLDEGDRGAMPMTGWADRAIDVPDKTIGVFFGRSFRGHARVAMLLRDIRHRTDRTLTWLPWGSSGHFRPLTNSRRFRAMRVPLREHDVGAPTPGDLFAAMRRCDFVVTDTYHVALNAWACGTPAVIVIDSTPPRPHNINSGSEFSWRDKRFEAYSTFDALAFLVHLDELSDPRRRRRRVEQLQGLFAETAAHEHVQARITAIKDAAVADFTATLRELLAAPTA